MLLRVFGIILLIFVAVNSSVAQTSDPPKFTLPTSSANKVISSTTTTILKQVEGPPNFWQEFDITFWQTFPFATLIGYIGERQLSSIMFPGSAVHWDAIIAFSTILSAGNAAMNAQKVMDSEKDNHISPSSVKKP